MTRYHEGKVYHVHALKNHRPNICKLHIEHLLVSLTYINHYAQAIVLTINTEPRKGHTLWCAIGVGKFRGTLSCCGTLLALQKKGDVWICLWIPCI